MNKLQKKKKKTQQKQANNKTNEQPTAITTIKNINPLTLPMDKDYSKFAINYLISVVVSLPTKGYRLLKCIICKEIGHLLKNGL